MQIDNSHDGAVKLERENNHDNDHHTDADAEIKLEPNDDADASIETNSDSRDIQIRPGGIIDSQIKTES